MREEILKKAIYGEIEAMNFYKGVAEKVENKSVKDELLKLSNQEKKHKEMLEKRYFKKFGKNFVPEGGLVFNPDLNAEKYHIDNQTVALQVVSIAIQAEEDAINFYSDELKNAEDEEDRKLLEELIKMEKRHKKKLQEEYDKVKKRYYWNIKE